MIDGFEVHPNHDLFIEPEHDIEYNYVQATTDAAIRSSRLNCLTVTGKDALNLLQNLSTNDL